MRFYSMFFVFFVWSSITSPYPSTPPTCTQKAPLTFGPSIHISFYASAIFILHSLSVGPVFVPDNPSNNLINRRYVKYVHNYLNMGWKSSRRCITTNNFSALFHTYTYSQIPYTRSMVIVNAIILYNLDFKFKVNCKLNYDYVNRCLTSFELICEWN